MRLSTIAPLAAVLALAAGCTLNDFDEDHHREVNVWMARTLHNAAGENAVIEQRTLYPYHFASESAELTPLGRKTLDILAGHYRRHPGPLNLRKGGASDDLYASRVESIQVFLDENGVDSSLIPIRDVSPGGDGMWSEEVLLIRSSAAEATAAGGSEAGAANGARAEGSSSSSNMSSSGSSSRSSSSRGY